MKVIVLIGVWLSCCITAHAQSNINADCINAIPLCSNPSFTFNSTSGVGNVADIPANSNISNPSTNPASNNSGCLHSGELKPQWLIITIGNAGFLEFVFGAGNSPHPQVGFYDWAMWPYSPTTCAAIQNNQLAPIRCNWNASMSGGTGIASASNIPVGGASGNYEPPLAVLPCQQYIICISNYSGVNTLVSFQSIGSASLSCNPNCLSVNNPSICAGQSATIIAAASGALANINYSLQPGGVTSANPTFVVNPLSTTNYTVFASGLNTQSAVVTQSAISNVVVGIQPTIAPTLTQATCINTLTAFQMNLGFTGTPANSGYSVQWSPQPAPITSNTQTAFSGSTAPGVYAYTVTANGGCAVSSVFTIASSPAPAAFLISPAGTVFSITCAQPVVTVQALNPALNYTWSQTNQPAQTGAIANFTLNQVGTWTVQAKHPVSLCTSAQTFMVVHNTIAPQSIVQPTFQQINCTNLNPLQTTVNAISPLVNVQHCILSPNNSSLISTNANTAYSPGIPGIYTVITQNMLNGCTVAKQFTLVSSQGFPTFTLGSPQNFTLGCASKSVVTLQILNAQTTSVNPTTSLQVPTGGPVSYTLLGPPTSSILSANLSTVNVYSLTSAGTWTAVVKDIGPSGCITRIPFTVLNNAFPPSIDSIRVPQKVLNCAVPQTTLIGFSSTPNITSQWSFNILNTVQGNSISVAANFTAPTNIYIANYTFNVKDNSNLCEQFTIVPIFQNLFPPKALIAGTGSLTCLNKTLTLTNNSSTGIPQNSGYTTSLPVIAQTWLGPPPQASLANSSTYKASYPGTYTLYVTDLNNGCKSSVEFYLAEDVQLPSVNTPTIPGPFVLDCGSDTVRIIPDYKTDLALLKFQWLAPLGAATSDPTKSVLISDAPGVYRIVVSNILNGCISTSEMQVINGTLTADFKANPIRGFAPLPVDFTNLSRSSSNILSLNSTWNFGNGSYSVTETSTLTPKIQYQHPGTYTVQLHTQRGTCIESKQLIIIVDQASELQIPNIFTPNNDGINDIFLIPNAGIKNMALTITNRWGVKVFYTNSDSEMQIVWDGTRNGEPVPDGVYFISLNAIGYDNRVHTYNGTLTLVR